MSDDRAGFVERYGAVFESSPWVAEEAWAAEGPFEGVEEMHAAMVRAIDRASEERQLELIRAHPELAPAEAALGDDLTPASAAEQSNAGLDRMELEQGARLERATNAYRDKFGFPYVVCVREHNPESIIADAQERLASTTEEERRTALREIAKIALLRLEDA